jgi:hypothetical protein
MSDWPTNPTAMILDTEGRQLDREEYADDLRARLAEDDGDYGERLPLLTGAEAARGRHEDGPFRSGRDRTLSAGRLARDAELLHLRFEHVRGLSRPAASALEFVMELFEFGATGHQRGELVAGDLVLPEVADAATPLKQEGTDRRPDMRGAGCG